MKKMRNKWKTEKTYVYIYIYIYIYTYVFKLDFGCMAGLGNHPAAVEGSHAIVEELAVVGDGEVFLWSRDGHAAGNGVSSPRKGTEGMEHAPTPYGVLGRCCPAPAPGPRSAPQSECIGGPLYARGVRELGTHIMGSGLGQAREQVSGKPNARKYVTSYVGVQWAVGAARISPALCHPVGPDIKK